MIRVLSPEDFVLFKVLSTRDRDLEDAASVLRSADLPLDRGFVDPGRLHGGEEAGVAQLAGPVAGAVVEVHAPIVAPPAGAS